MPYDLDAYVFDQPPRPEPATAPPQRIPAPHVDYDRAVNVVRWCSECRAQPAKRGGRCGRRSCR